MKGFYSLVAALAVMSMAEAASVIKFHEPMAGPHLDIDLK